jgi:hypothetical protein
MIPPNVREQIDSTHYEVEVVHNGCVIAKGGGLGITLRDDRKVGTRQLSLDRLIRDSDELFFLRYGRLP